jgi:hypothetical protein
LHDAPFSISAGTKVVIVQHLVSGGNSNGCAFQPAQRLSGNTRRQASSGELDTLRQENEQLKQLVAELALKNRVLKKSVLGSDSGWDD